MTRPRSSLSSGVRAPPVSDWPCSGVRSSKPLRQELAPTETNWQRRPPRQGRRRQRRALGLEVSRLSPHLGRYPIMSARREQFHSTPREVGSSLIGNPTAVINWTRLSQREGDDQFPTPVPKRRCQVPLDRRRRPAEKNPHGLALVPVHSYIPVTSVNFKASHRSLFKPQG
jgi:hypothetical protein